MKPITKIHSYKVGLDILVVYHIVDRRFADILSNHLVQETVGRFYAGQRRKLKSRQSTEIARFVVSLQHIAKYNAKCRGTNLHLFDDHFASLDLLVGTFNGVHC